LEEYEHLSDPGAKGALLRREGLYSSHVVEWRRAREAGALEGLGPKARRPKASAEQKEVERLKKANARLSDQLERHRQALEIQGKASELLAKLLAESSEQTEQPRQRP
jgi:transposase